MKQPVFFEPGEGKRVTARGSRMLFKAVAETTDGAFSFMARELPAGNRRPAPHRHAGPEGFYVLEGRIAFTAGGERRTGGPGFWALVPGGVSHTFGNAGETPARLLIIHAPAADDYFAALEQLWAGDTPPAPSEERDLMRRHGLEPDEDAPGQG
jgi:quercetin dioxygenase-like cupin family protein